MNSRALIIAGCLVAFGFVGCGKKADEAPKTDSTATVPAADSTMHAADSTHKVADSTLHASDSTHKAADSTMHAADSTHKAADSTKQAATKKGVHHSEAAPKTTAPAENTTPSAPEAHGSTQRRPAETSTAPEGHASKVRRQQ